MILLPLLSRITSNSISFQPATDFSSKIWLMGDRRRPLSAISRSSASLLTIPPPLPPSVKAGRTITGYCSFSASTTASSTVVTISEGIHGWPIFSIVSLKSWRSSARSIVSGRAPSNRTLLAAKKPSLASCIERVRPVCPPKVERILSGFSFLIIRLSTGKVNGSI